MVKMDRTPNFSSLVPRNLYLSSVSSTRHLSTSLSQTVILLSQKHKNVCERSGHFVRNFRGNFLLWSQVSTVLPPWKTALP